MSGESDPTATPKTVLARELEQGKMPAAKKQKSDLSAERLEEDARPKRSFKAIANLVLAMKRFQAALNPQYEYGKGKQPPLVRHVRTTSDHTRGTSSGGEEVPTTSPTTSTGGVYAYADRGHKAEFLFKSLPPAPGEEGAVSSPTLPHSDGKK